MELFGGTEDFRRTDGCFGRYFETTSWYSDCPTEPLENKWIGSIHAPFTPDWIRSPLLKVAAASERTTKGLENVWKTLAIPIYRQALSLAAHTLLSRQVADDRSIIQFSYRRKNFSSMNFYLTKHIYLSLHFVLNTISFNGLVCRWISASLKAACN